MAQGAVGTPLADLGGIWGAHLGANMVPKSLKKSINKIIDLLIAPGRALGRQK